MRWSRPLTGGFANADMGLPRGFKADAERMAEGCRADLGLQPWEAMSPIDLADALAIPLLPLTEIVDEAPAASILAGPESSAFSAATVFDGHARLIVYNDAHTVERQCSDIAHEISHGLLLHEPRPALDALGCRDWDAAAEEQAAHLGGALLVPRAGAYRAASRGWSLGRIALEFGCSEPMARWRMQITGAARLMRT